MVILRLLVVMLKGVSSIVTIFVLVRRVIVLSMNVRRTLLLFRWGRVCGRMLIRFVLGRVVRRRR